MWRGAEVTLTAASCIAVPVPFVLLPWFFRDGGGSTDLRRLNMSIPFTNYMAGRYRIAKPEPRKSLLPQRTFWDGGGGTD